MLEKTSIRAQIAIMSILAAIAPVLLFASASYNKIHQKFEEQVANIEQLEVENQSDKIEYALQQKKTDIIYLSKSQLLQSVLQGQAPENYTQELTSFIEANPSYCEIVYINESGQEEIKVENKDGKITSSKELGSKKNQYYFQQTSSLDANQIYISPIDLNTDENLYIATPHTPVIKYATPIFDVSNNFRGILLTKIYAENFLSIIENQEDKASMHYIADQDGDYLKHPDSSKEWGHSLQTESNLFKDIPELKNFPDLDKDSGLIEKNSTIITFNYIKVGEQNLILFSSTPKLFASTYLIENLSTIIIVTVLTLLLTIIMTILASKEILAPLEKLNKGVKHMLQEDFSYRIEIPQKNEIGTLASSFNQMADQVGKRVNKQTKNAQNLLKDVENQNKEIIRQRDILNSIFYSINEGLIVVDTQFKIRMFNKTAVQLTGLTKAEVMNKNYKEVIEYGAEGNNTNNKSKKLSPRLLLITRSGEEIPIERSITPLLDKQNKIFGYIIVIRDETHKRAVARAKTEFVSLASHQLRTPITTANWYIEMLLNGDLGKVTKEQKDSLNEIYAANQRMIKLINSLLNISRIEMGTYVITPTPTDLPEMTKEIIKESMFKIKEKNLKILENYSKGIGKVNLDQKIMTIILQNLISNAVKYTLENGTVTVEIKKVKQNIHIIVKDSGIGIPKDQQPKIFNKFYRANNAAKVDGEGSGLGLYMVQSLLDETGGSISFKSHEGKGSTFTVTIPITGMQKKEGTKSLT